MAGSTPQLSRQWHAVGAVVAAYAGTHRGHPAFLHALTTMKQALPAARLWVLGPADARVEADDVDGTIEYPLPGSSAVEDAAAREGAMDAIRALEVCGASAAVVLAERGTAPYFPAYLCYLGGIAYRAGAEAEFGGTLLRPALPLADLQDDVERHLALLAAVGLVCREEARLTAIPPASTWTNRSIGCNR